MFRGQGADNVTWLWTINQDRANTGPIASWWPGAQYVTWVGIDGYYFRPTDTFTTVFGATIEQVRALTSKPILLSETAVGPQAGQFAKIGDLFSGMRQYQTLGPGLVRQGAGRRHLPSGLAHRGRRHRDAAFRLGISSLAHVDP